MCIGPVKCGDNQFCVGFEGNIPYCYGDKDGCKWNREDCTKDSDCAQYNTDSPKFTDVKHEMDCSDAGGWRADASTCNEGSGA